MLKTLVLALFFIAAAGVCNARKEPKSRPTWAPMYKVFEVPLAVLLSAVTHSRSKARHRHLAHLTTHGPL